MAPSNLQGLNLVHTAPEPAQAELQDSLTSPFPDFSAHLDLWTNLAFDTTDEPLAQQKLKRKQSDDNDDSNPPSSLDMLVPDGHESAIHPPGPANHPNGLESNPGVPPFDINGLLASFGVNPFMAPPPVSTPVPQHSNAVPPSQLSVIPSLAQLLAIHTAQGGTYSVPPPPPVISAPIQTSASASASAPSPPASAPAPAPTPQPAAKRARTQKNTAQADHSDVSAAQSPQDPSSPTAGESSSQTMSATEDKRRRNTAASARFRLKKKEREAALERRAKELEERVLELERECEGLRRENGWLKGLVVGVTGAGAAQQQQPQK
ncbi:hypothetical protein ID866_1454 [Astraeus odoratus]|nr:hypothetical protein ID866_1454 [Astraeus odoratus]